MKKILFTKIQGAGNDFIIVNAVGAQRAVPLQFNKLKKLAIAMCNRHTGIGADGLLILDKSKAADYRMRIINADGSSAEMCGNGARCMAAYIVKTQKPRKKLFSIETLAGLIKAEAKGEVANVRLSDPRDYAADIPLELNGRNIRVHYIDTGVPHTIIFVNGLETIDVAAIGNPVRYHEQFKPRGTNVDFVEQLNGDCVALRTYERGVEGETLACGTGSVAAALVGYLQANPDVQTKRNARMKVRTASGEILQVTFNLREGKISDVWLKGSAKFIAKGEYYV
jgi:diaminopimelate epimerase